MKKNKRFIIAISTLFVISCVLGFSGCALISGKKELLEEGDFLYHNYSSEFIFISGFSKEGRKKAEIVFPKEIGGIPVHSLGNEETIGIESTPRNYFYGEKEQYGECMVEKVFIPSNVNLTWYGSRGTFGGCTKLYKVVFLSADPQNYSITKYGVISRAQTDIKYICLGNIIIAAGYKEKYEEKFEGKFLEANIEFLLNYHVDATDEEILQYREELTNQNKYSETEINALVTEYENKNHAENEGIYWIDHLDENQKLRTIPQNPEREGYNFDGWYMDEECTLPVDLGSVIPNADGSTAFLYAKWEIK